MGACPAKRNIWVSEQAKEMLQTKKGDPKAALKRV
jgi:hypothetical protein